MTSFEKVELIVDNEVEDFDAEHLTDDEEDEFDKTPSYVRDSRLKVLPFSDVKENTTYEILYIVKEFNSFRFDHQLEKAMLIREYPAGKVTKVVYAPYAFDREKIMKFLKAHGAFFKYFGKKRSAKTGNKYADVQIKPMSDKGRPKLDIDEARKRATQILEAVEHDRAISQAENDEVKSYDAAETSAEKPKKTTKKKSTKKAVSKTKDEASEVSE